jgi:outer membrane protein OmpA-like peptidoglycan-associated protein
VVVEEEIDADGEVIDEVVIDEEIVVEEVVEDDGEVVDEVVDEVIVEEDAEIEVDEGAAVEVVEAEEVAVVVTQPAVGEVEVAEEVVGEDVVLEPVAAEAVVMETEVDVPEPQIMSPMESPDDALPPQRVTTVAVVEEPVPGAVGVSEVLVEDDAVEVEVAAVEVAAAPDPTQGSMSQTFDALFAASGPDATADTPTTTITSSGYQTLVAVIKFNEGSSGLDANDRLIIKDIAASHERQGGAIRLAGHASRQAGVAEQTDELLANFNISLDRATAVADELVRQGVASDDIVIDAQGDQAFVNVAGGQLDEADQRRVDVYFTN